MSIKNITTVWPTVISTVRATFRTKVITIVRATVTTTICAIVKAKDCATVFFSNDHFS